MYSKLLVLVFWSFLQQFREQSQDHQFAILNVDLSQYVEKPNRLVIERHGLANYAVIADTIKIKDGKFMHSIRIEEPELVFLVVLWPNEKRRSTSFRAFPSTYQLTTDKQQKLVIKNTNSPSKSEKEFEDIKRDLEVYDMRTDSLTSLVSYENRQVTEVELKIVVIRDSIENLIDDEVYLKYALEHLNSAAGLYAFANYADRPLEKRRRKWQPGYVKKLLHQFNPSIKGLPTFKLLNDKITLAEQLLVGNMGKDLTLTDSAGIIIYTKNFRGKYLLIDFWASWCVPCRVEHPQLINAYNTYKGRGFEILSITLDTRNQAKFWKDAISADRIGIWSHASDYNHFAQREYDISVIPSNFLLDPTGKIITVDLKPNHLSTHLAKIFDQ
jgi:thiol-disulfide isomerase/thioredoxin